ncbi:ABC transporter ATP-binding protein [Comamonas sp. Tr-654]|uniref:ABC transporter ATP-binding protein n=1 Tax=Comamonas sp. Tr-654 TaxID=2608341 RepID=UPI0014209CE5|nr:ABC transporter ATP-binding protein [Comamonas sp. Tr-654]NIF82083.1 ABC transporter ATP-binding protein [Comamonas sp. Tr-654]
MNSILSSRQDAEIKEDGFTACAVSLRNIGKSFGPRQVLQHIDLDIAQGEFVSLIGPSGAGKSTLLRLIAGLEAGSSGRMQLSSPEPGRPAQIRVMFQEDRLLPWQTVLDNITLGAREQRPAALELLRAVGLQGHENDFPSTLSGGQKQRAALARALLHRPDILLLDEPFGALDAITRVSMQLLLFDMLRDHPCAVVLVTHDVEEAVVLSNRILVLRDGGIARDLALEGAIPRDRGSADLATLKARLINELLVQEALHEAAQATSASA